jgi:molybdenum cofactor biosynthesis protein B
MGVADHKVHAPKQVRVFVVTVSDTRTEDNDTSGRAAKEMITAAGHVVAGYRILKDEPAQVAALVQQIVAERAADVIVTSGGTGVSTRDSTYEAIAGLLDKRLDGFGEIFRMLSWNEVGSRAMASRAVAGVHGKTLIFSMPGSTKAVRLAMEKLVAPELGHLAGELKKQP